MTALQKVKAFRSKKLTDAAEGRPCVLCGACGTTVAAHSNALSHGRGMGLKAPDFMVAYVCQRHHDLIDGRAGLLAENDKREMWMRAWARTVKLWFDEGIVIVK